MQKNTHTAFPSVVFTAWSKAMMTQCGTTGDELQRRYKQQLCSPAMYPVSTYIYDIPIGPYWPAHILILDCAWDKAVLGWLQNQGFATLPVEYVFRWNTFWFVDPNIWFKIDKASDILQGESSECPSSPFRFVQDRGTHTQHTHIYIYIHVYIYIYIFHIYETWLC